jgi:predicted nucleotidyltransferase component of viral defense system
MKDWRVSHGKVIADFMLYLNSQTDKFVLKGGTALYLCYALDRFSEDIDLDGRAKGLIELVSGFCEKYGYKYRVAKQTDTVQRCMIHYGNEGKPLKIEASYRRREIDVSETQFVNGILVYGIEELCVMKINAYTSRDKIRDLYDVTFICKQYFSRLSPQTIALLRNAIEYKGIEQFDFIIKDQSDELIDNDKLAEDFLAMYNRLGLLYDHSEAEEQGGGMTLQ